MHTTYRVLVATSLLLLLAMAARAQQQYVVGERFTGNAYKLVDITGDGDALDAGEKTLWASGLGEVTELRRFGASVLGVNRTAGTINLLRDLTGDGDCLDAGENVVWASGLSAGFGLTVGKGGVVYAADYAADSLRRLLDVNGDGDALDAGENVLYAQGLGGVVSVLAGQKGLFTTGYSGGYVSKLVDLTGDGDCLDAGENVAYSPSSIASPNGLLAGRGGAIFAGSRGANTVYRLLDVNGDGDAMGVAETLSYADTVYGGVSGPWNMAPHASGGFLLGNYTGAKVTLVRDLNGDGDALDTGEGVLFADGIATPTGLEALRGPGGGMLTIIKKPGTLDPGSPNFYAIVDGSTVGCSVASAALNAGKNVIVSTDNPYGFEVGGILQEPNAPLLKTAGGDVSIAMQADDSIYLWAGLTSTSGRLHVRLAANDPALAYRDTDGNVGDVVVLGPITTNGGSFWAGGVNFLNYNAGDVHTGGGDVAVSATGFVMLQNDLLAGDGNLAVTAPSGVWLLTGRMGGRGTISEFVSSQQGGIEVTSGQLTLNGTLAVDSAGSLTKTGLGTLSLTGPQVWGTGSVVHVQAGTLAYAIAGGSVTVLPGERLMVELAGTATAGPGSDPFTDWIDANRHVDVWNDGLFRMISGAHVVEAVSPVDPNLLRGKTQLDAGASLSVRLIRQEKVTVGVGALLTLRGGSRTTSDVNTLVIAGATDAWTGTVDIRQNYLVVRGGGAITIENQVKSGLNLASGYWDGKGITSSLAAADTNYYTAVGVLDNSLAGFTTFGDATGLTGSEVLVRYTFYGDADLSGTVDFDNDYILWQTGFLNGYSGWVYGDFNYDGVVDFDNDYILWQTLFLNQPALPGGAAVPEPATVALIGLGLTGLLARRSRKTRLL